MTELRDDDRTALVRDGWRIGSDQRWRNDRFGGAYKAENALRRIGSRRGEVTRPMDDEETARFLKGYAAGANDMEAGGLVTLTADDVAALDTILRTNHPYSGTKACHDLLMKLRTIKLSLIANGENG